MILRGQIRGLLLTFSTSCYPVQNGLTLEDFVKNTIQKSHYVIVQPDHAHAPLPYTNPLHRILGVFRHFAAYFVDTSEHNPIVGTLALAAYFYGG